MRKRRQRQGLMSEINITPFTDVLLVLLIIFMVATPIIYQGKLDLKLPESKVAEKTEKSEKITIFIAASGQISLGSEIFTLPTDDASLRERISGMAAAGPDTAVIINGDRDATYNMVFKVIDLLGELKLRKILLGAEIQKGAI